MKTIQQFYDELIQEKQNFSSLNGLTPISDTNQQFLNDLTSNSRVAVWRFMLWIVAFASWINYSLFQTHKEEIEKIASEAIPGTAKWLRKEVFKFQLGYALQWIDNKYSYPTIDPSARIIKYCAVVETGGSVRVKVAKLNSSNQPAPLSGTELLALKDYINEIKFAGTVTNVTTGNADLLKLQLKIYYDPQVLDAAGVLLSDGVTKPVEVAVNNYIKNLSFNGILYVNQLIDAIQMAQGVDQPYITLIEAKYGGFPYQSVIEKYQADAGYLIIDPNFPLSNNITYIPNV